MSNAEKAVEAIREAIEGKRVLEVACGCAEFTIEAAKLANEVQCIDLETARIPEKLPENVTFTQMDASKMTFADASFDTVVMYNAVGHLEDVLGPVLAQCRRVVKPGGAIYVLSTWMMDKFVIEQSLLTALVESKSGAAHTRREAGNLTIVKIGG